MPLPIMLAHRIVPAARRGAQGATRSRTCGPTGRRRSRSATRSTSTAASGRSRSSACSSRPSTATGSTRDRCIKPDLIEHVLQPILPGELYDEARFEERDFVLVNPTGTLRHRRADGRHRPHRPQDHRRHLRRRGAPRRRRVLGQGSDEGRPLGRLRGALRREERRRGRARRPLRDAGRLRDRRRAPGLDRGRLLRHRAACRRPGSRSSCASTSTCGPAAIIRDLDLRRPIYAKTAAYGHFGRDDHDFTWERTDKAEALARPAGSRPRPPRSAGLAAC